MKKQNTHVIANSSGGWSVRKEGASRASGVFVTQKEAVTHARKIAKAGGAELFIHGRDGTIRERDTYGRDPIPPRNNK